MLALQPRNMLNMLAASNPMAYGFAKARRAAFAACFIVYSGIISATVALWMWMWRDTTFQLNTIARIVALTLICAAVYLYPRLRRGFGTFCLILLTSGIGLAIYCQSQPLLPGNRPQMPAIALISVGLIVYRTWTDKDKQKHHHTSIVIDSFTLLGRPEFQTGESAPDPDDGGGTVAVDADQSSELHDDNPF